MNEQAPNPLESLQLIDTMINKARNRFSENGHLYLLWGWVVLFCSLGHYLLEHVFHYPRFYMVWMAIWGAVVYQFIYLARRKRKEKVSTYTDDILKYVWMVFGITFILVALVCSRFVPNANDINALILVVYGMPLFLSGAILKFRPLRIGAICCWLLALSTLKVPPQYFQLLVCAGVISGWIIPGYLLRLHFQKQQREAEQTWTGK